MFPYVSFNYDPSFQYNFLKEYMQRKVVKAQEMDLEDDEEYEEDLYKG